MPREVGFSDDTIGEVGSTQPPEPTPDPRLVAAFRRGAVQECPVCRSTSACLCSEDDRAFVRRTRFDADVQRVPRCGVCASPLSVIYLPRVTLSPGTKGSPPRLRLDTPPVMPGSNVPSLAGYGAIWACAVCQGEALAAVIFGARR